MKGKQTGGSHTLRLQNMHNLKSNKGARELGLVKIVVYP